MPKISHTEPIPISQISPIPNRYRYRVHTNFVHTDTDTGYRYLVSVPGIGTLYWYLVSVPGIGIIPGIGQTLVRLTQPTASQTIANVSFISS